MFFCTIISILFILCSNPSNAIDRRIINGINAADGEYPYHVSLREPINVHLCSGSILSRQWILTTSFCILMTPEFVIVVGSNTINGSGDTYQVDSIQIHPLYDTNNLDYAAGLVNTTTPIVYSIKVQPIVLTPLVPIDGASVVISGYGSNVSDQDTFTNELKAFNTTVISQTECGAQLSQIGFNLGSTHICTSVAEGSSSCYFDYGSPVTDPKVMDPYDKGVFYRSNVSESIFSVIFEDTINVWKNEPSLQKYYEKTTDEITKKIYEVRNRDSKLNVLNHGDFWCNNLLFHYDADERLDDVLFVDFQGSVFASPFVDLHYFIATSTSQEVKEKHIYDILRYYYDTLVENVKLFKVETAIPNWNDFEKDFRDKAFIGFITMCIALPVIKAKNIKNASVDNLIGSDEDGSFRRNCFTNTLYLNEIKFLLQFYDSLGVFNN
ncbi:hypothetical protein RN001_013738 [Aquatica leii]|uniref:Peptidase S1 domain-containing protein n=1 Tax=Aquatica leii TaxID=1421715 RepID=A0AAN7SLQ6_9COLE|nr:hypothetical protein RN001_013738 [Aquatica leii]